MNLKQFHYYDSTFRWDICSCSRRTALNLIRVFQVNMEIGKKVHGGLCKQMQNGFTYGISAWNLYAGFLSNETFRETLQFVNRHKAMNASTSPAAFISFRDSLNTENVERWPEANMAKFLIYLGQIVLNCQIARQHETNAINCK